MPRNAAYTVLIIALVAALSFGGLKLYETAREKLRLDALLPDVAKSVRAIRQELADKGIKTLVGQTFRTSAEQAGEVEEGSSATERSWHRVRRAIDLYPYREGQAWDKGSWEDYQLMYQIASKYGGTNIGETNGEKRYITTSAGKIWDGGHLQFTGGLTWDQAMHDLEAAV